MFTYSDYNLTNEWSGDLEVHPRTEFSNMLRYKWDQLHDDSNVFRYKLGNIRERIIDKKTRYLLQLNPDRGSNRRSPEEIANLNQPFNTSKFNFTKVSPQEIMFDLVDEQNATDLHRVIVNVSPISRYHSLLCPSVNKCLPQVATKESLKLAIDMFFLFQDRDLRIGFNSLCAMASVNHLHYHLLMENNTLPVEIAKCNHIKGPLYIFDDSYLAPGFCFQIKHKHSIPQLAEDVHKLVRYLHENNVPYNILVTRGQGMGWEGTDEIVRVVVWPRRGSYVVKLLGAFNVAVCELSGWFPVYNDDDFENLRTEDIEIEIKKWRPEAFDILCQEIKSLF
ncbi:hypothetical protein JYU34_010086 [Plutella xylostella]|uniref:GDP-D-glucose phosphorylase 1 n=1 Tax=Plutella xylostella TaxID=51655 RepID=A0ABQ7QHM8_PLUXY|nr:hypothetical protein JYU34_010086 [Plutella xylostella]